MASALTLDLSPGQLQKLARAYQQRTDVTVNVSPDQIRLDNNKPNLLPALTAKACKCKKTGKGFRLALSQVRGGLLPLIPALAALLPGILSGGAAIAKTVMDNKRKYRQLDETRRHNEALERGKGICCPTCKGSGIFLTTRPGHGLKKATRR